MTRSLTHHSRSKPRDNNHTWKPSKCDIHGRTEVIGLSKSPCESQLPALQAETNIAAVPYSSGDTSYLSVDVLPVLLQLLCLSVLCMSAVWCSAEKRFVTVGKSSVYKAWAHTSCLGLNLSFDVIGRENGLLNRASFHQIKRHHERQHRILALRHKDYLQDRRERFRITRITYKRWSWSPTCGNIQKRW